MQLLYSLLLLFFTFGFKETFCRSPPWERNSVRSCQCRIVGGDPVSIEEVPYQVQLATSSNFVFCGGSIIDAYTVLTAAHCLESARKIKVIIASDIISEGKPYEVKKKHLHPKYEGEDDNGYDVGVVKLATPMDLDGVKAKPVKLVASGADTAPGTPVLVSGWGATSEGGSGSKKLLAVKVKVVSDKECKEAYGDNLITSTMICLADAGKDSCQGDSGGPAVVVETGELVGIVSWGKGCARPGYPGVYAKVADPSVQEFINKHMGS